MAGSAETQGVAEAFGWRNAEIAVADKQAEIDRAAADELFANGQMAARATCTVLLAQAEHGLAEAQSAIDQALAALDFLWVTKPDMPVPAQYSDEAIYEIGSADFNRWGNDITFNEGGLEPVVPPGDILPRLSEWMYSPAAAVENPIQLMQDYLREGQARSEQHSTNPDLEVKKVDQESSIARACGAGEGTDQGPWFDPEQLGEYLELPALPAWLDEPLSPEMLNSDGEGEQGSGENLGEVLAEQGFEPFSIHIEPEVGEWVGDELEEDWHWYDWLNADKSGINAFFRSLEASVSEFLWRGSKPASQWERERRLAGRIRAMPTSADLGLADLRDQLWLDWEEREHARITAELLRTEEGRLRLIEEAFAADSRKWWGDKITAFAPGYSDYRDFYEAITGLDMITKMPLSRQEQLDTIRASMLPFISGRDVRIADGFLKSRRLDPIVARAAGGRTLALRSLIRAEMQTFGLGEGWLQAGRRAGLRLMDSLVYIVRDKRTGELLKVGETERWERRFGEYYRRARQEAREIEVVIFRIESHVRLDRVAIERQVRLLLNREGHELPWDLTIIGKQYLGYH